MDCGADYRASFDLAHPHRPGGPAHAHDGTTTKPAQLAKPPYAHDRSLITPATIPTPTIPVDTPFRPS